MVRMAHSGHLPPSLAALKQQLLDECQRVADDDELSLMLSGGSRYSSCLCLCKLREPSVGRNEEYQQAPWDRLWDDVRVWKWDDVPVGGAEQKVTSVCLLLALLPSLHPRLTYLGIFHLSELEVMGGPREWVAQAMEVLCAAMLSLSRESTNTIRHLKLKAVAWSMRKVGDDVYMEGGSVHLSHLLRSTHCNLLSLWLADYIDKQHLVGCKDEGEGGNRELTTLGHIARALQVNTTLTTLRMDWCKLCACTAHEIAALLSVNTILQRLQFVDVRFTQDEAAAYLRRALCGAQSRTNSKAPTIPFGSGALTTLGLRLTELGEKGTSWVPWLGDMLAHNVSLYVLDLRSSGLRDGAGRDLAEGLRLSNSSLKVLDITDNKHLSAQDMQHIFSALQNHATLQIFRDEDVLIQQGAEGVEDMACALARMISTNQSLHTLEYPCAPFSATQWLKHIVPALLANRTLKVIDFQSCKGIRGINVYRGFLHLIRTHTMIQDLRLEKTPLYESGQAQAILKELQLCKTFSAPTSKPASAHGKSTMLGTMKQLLSTGSTTHSRRLKLAAQKCKQLFKLQSPHDKEEL